jgi:hypothetical protein
MNEIYKRKIFFLHEFKKMIILYILTGNSLIPTEKPTNFSKIINKNGILI